MEKREKIIVIATVLAALYGTVDFLFLSKNKEAPAPQKRQERLSSVAAELATQTQGKGSKIRQLVNQIHSPWPKNVFFSKAAATLFNQPEESVNKEAITAQFNPNMFDYSGYLQMGANKMAIINGSDYKIGDNINGFILAEIRPDTIKVVLEGMPFNVQIKPAINP